MGTDYLAEGLEVLGLSDRPGLAAALAVYQRELETWNERLGLVSLKDPSDLVVKHFLDSLAPWKVLDALGFGSLVDLGSGAGFPGIPLALTFPVRTVLVERMERRAGFLQATLGALGRTDVEVLPRTFEEVKARFDVVTFRAVTALEPKIVKKMLRLLTPGGQIVAYKGRRAVIEAEVAGLAPLGLRTEVVPVSVPFLDEERHLVVLRPQA